MVRASPVLRNTVLLVGAQIAGTPLAIIVAGVTGRYLGAEAVGYMFVAQNLARLGFLVVEWGHSGVLPAEVARNRAAAGELLGTSIVWRIVASAVVCIVLSVGSWFLLGHGRVFQVVLALTALQWVLNTLGLACQDTVKGFERTDVSAGSQLLGQFLNVAVVVPTLMLGGLLNATLVAQAVVAAIMLVVVWLWTRKVGVRNVSVSKTALVKLTSQGKYFLSFGVAMALQATVDTILLTRLATPEVVGWQAAAQRLVGVLLIPATALIAALYPTLSRLHVEDREHYVSTVRQSLRGALVLAVPMAACCGLYRELGIRLFGKEGFAPAQQNLLVFAVLLLVVYVSMPLGTALMAAGRQRAWTFVQLACVVVSLALDPLLIPWFQEHYGNGGIGVCVAGVVSTSLMVVSGLVMIGRGVVDLTLFVVCGKALVAGAAMIGLGLLLSGITPFVAAPIALLAYCGVLWLIGGVTRDEVEIARGAVMRRLRRSAA
jgi:O-antigen/teichoic acid export membrane protein